MLQIKNISKQYRTGELIQQALNDVSFSLRDNEFVSILGPSGSGKTTLLNIIGGLDRYDSGDLIINGVSTKKYKDKEWDTYRNHTIGFVFQSYNLIPHQNILSNVELALTIGGVSVRERKKRAREALIEVGLGEHIHKKPNQLSGGQMQRVAIARALVNDPDILLADEPTGALDSETSVQIMELLKKVAEKRLVVMVTHNGELAEEYSTRIVRLKDGKIVSDTNPVTEQEIAGNTASDQSANKVSAKGIKTRNNARMSFLTCLALSANNLRSKKGRTILISLACSIGIIGIALILSVSTGVNDYILNIQKETMSSYPITISAQTVDLSGLMSESTSMRRDVRDLFENGREDDGSVHSDFSTMRTSELFTTSFVENNLTDFKKYLDNPESPISKYLGENGIIYKYNVDFDVYTTTPGGELQNTDSSVNNLSTDGSSFSRMNAGLSFMRSNMFSWNSSRRSGASNFSELPAGNNGQAISQIVKDNYEVVNGRWPEEYNEVAIVLSPIHTIPAETLYQLGIMSSEEYVAAAETIENGGEPEDASWTYEELLDKSFYLVTASDHYVKNEEGNFMYIDDSYLNQPALMNQAVELKVVGIIIPSENASVTNINSTVCYTSKLTDYCISHADESEVIQAQKAEPSIDVLTGVRFQANTVEEKAEDAVKIIKAMPDAEKSQLYTMLTYAQTAQEEAAANENVVGADTNGESAVDMNALAESAGDANTNGESAVDMNALAESAGDADTNGETASDTSAAEETENKDSGSSAGLSGSGESTGESADSESSGMEAMLEMYGLADNTSVQAITALLGKDKVESLYASLSDYISDESQNVAFLLQWLDNDPDKEVLAKLYDEYAMAGSYDDNMKSFGMVSYDAPVSISIYTDTFEDKDGLTACIDKYNESADEEHQIVYTDYIALITSSVTQMVDAISYVLIAFVAISLIVSSIMIGIITHISVLERTKEIGILRAMGASKRNISYVFNAETVIIGLISGLIGIFISLLLSIPINLILKSLLDSEMIRVNLPIAYAAVLVIISIIVTLIGGLIPAAKAAKKDPVIALRTE